MSEAVKVLCPACSQSYKVRQDKLGKQIACQKCGEMFTLAAAEAATAASPVPGPSVPQQPPAVPAAEAVSLQSNASALPIANSSEPAMSATSGSGSAFDRLRGNPAANGLKISFAGVAILAISIPLPWTIIYSSGFGESSSLSTSGWIMALPILAAIGFVFAQRKEPEKTKQHAKIVGGACAVVFLYALYDVLTTWTVSPSSFAGVTGGLKTGIGVWLAILGAIVCGVGQFFLTQADLLTATDADGKPRSWAESLDEVKKRAEQVAKRQQAEDERAQVEE